MSVGLLNIPKTSLVFPPTSIHWGIGKHSSRSVSLQLCGNCDLSSLSQFDLCWENSDFLYPAVSVSLTKKKSISLFSSRLRACFCSGTYQDDSLGCFVCRRTRTIDSGNYLFHDWKQAILPRGLFPLSGKWKEKRKSSPLRSALSRSTQSLNCLRSSAKAGFGGESPLVLKISFLWHLDDMLLTLKDLFLFLFQVSHNNLCPLFCLVSANLLPVRAPTGCLISA